MSWESTAEYYRIINETVRERLGGLHSARVLLYSVDFHEVESLQRSGRWEETTEVLLDAARRLERGGAACVLICTNTMHRVAPEIQQELTVPLLHIADATAAEIKRARSSRVGLLGTKYTMEQDFYKGRLIAEHGIEVLVPPEIDRDLVHNVIYNELCLGKALPESRQEFVRIIHDLAARKAEGVILGCTEISLLIGQEDCSLPLFDTTAIHARQAVDFALSPTTPESAPGPSSIA
jgi:aspartate racemase